MRYTCCDERRLQAVKEAGVLNGIEYVEVSDSEAPSQALRQRTLFVRLLQAGTGADARGERVDHRRRAHPDCGRVDAARRRGCGAHRRARRPVDRAARAHRLARGLLALHAAARRGRRQRGAAGGLRSVARVGRVLVQGRVPGRLRLQARLQLPARASRAAVDRLPGEGLPVVPLAHARPAQPARSRLDRAHAGGPGHRARRAARVRRGRAVVPAGRGRDRGVPRDCAPPNVLAPPRAARRLPRARGCECARLGACLRRRRRRRARRAGRRCSRASRTSRTSSIRTAASTAPRSRAVPRRSRRSPTRCSTRRTSASTSGRGATPAAACRAARRPRRSSATIPS